ncbi:hypothetical protein [Rhodococcoides kroppenstedtii]|uniref:hypothetical protein n=1 Tax=Rhodococcoides kroppenstedtii TaxID=293050 RepID=UPI001427B6E0|nr:hypothetical protein [Rhodococcus kroppenstedtii]NIL80423.1 hypothetical protein [Rhodococcus kroppenstedtii]
MSDRPPARHARHYVEFSATSTALHHTLDLVAEALGRPVALLHILDDTEQYVLAESGAPLWPAPSPTGNAVRAGRSCGPGNR